MVTIKLAILRHTRAKDGSYKIRISIGHHSETHYIVTRYRVASFNNFVNGTVIGQPDAKAINIKLRQLLNQYDDKLERIPNAADMTCAELRDLLRDMPDNSTPYTLQQIADRYFSNLRKEERSTTADLMAANVRKFLDFTNGDIFLSNITPRLIDDYQHHLNSQHLSPSYITLCISSISVLVNYAIKMQFVRYDVSPFLYYHRTESAPRDLDVSIEDMRKLFRFRPAMRATRRTLDIFLLSYMLGGINMKDLLNYRFDNLDTISYIRKKTRIKNTSNRPTTFSIPPEAREIIKRWYNPATGYLELYTSNYDSFMNSFNQSLKKIARLAGLDFKHLCFYSARKSFVQHGFELGIPLEVLEYCIGQSMKKNRPIFNYVKIMQRHADIAIRKIIDNAKNPPLSSQTEEG